MDRHATCFVQATCKQLVVCFACKDFVFVLCLDRLQVHRFIGPMGPMCCGPCASAHVDPSMSLCPQSAVVGPQGRPAGGCLLGHLCRRPHFPDVWTVNSTIGVVFFSKCVCFTTPIPLDSHCDSELTQLPPLGWSRHSRSNSCHVIC